MDGPLFRRSLRTRFQNPNKYKILFDKSISNTFYLMDSVFVVTELENSNIILYSFRIVAVINIQKSPFYSILLQNSKIS